MKYGLIFFFISCFVLANSSEKNDLSYRLRGFEPFIGKYFKGSINNVSKLKSSSEVIYFQRILNGQAIRISHSINHGEFGGETIIAWNDSNNLLESIYFSTGGTIKKSIVEIKDHKVILLEDLINDNSIKKVKTTYKLLLNGNLEKEIKYYIDKTWRKSHVLIYKNDKNSKLIFN